MEEKIIVIVGVLIRMGVRFWLGDKGENIIDIENIAESGTKKFWRSKKFNNTIDGFVMNIAEEFLDQDNIEFESVERRNEVLKQIEKDVNIVNIDSKKLLKDFTHSEKLCKTILDVNAEEREGWSEREKGYYRNCVKYISELCIKFMSKWPDFTTSGIEVIIERQNKYAKEIHSLAEELKKLNSVVMGTETTYRELEKKYRDEIICKYGKVDLIGSGIKDRKIRKYDISSAYVELNCYEDEYKGDIIFDFLQGGITTYDEEKSTDTIQYFYVENELSQNDKESIQNLRIEFQKFEGNGKHGEVYAEVLKTETLKAANVIEMPTLTWNIGKTEVKVSSIAAKVSDKKQRELQIVLKNDKTITDYFDYNLVKIGKDGTIPEDSFTTKEEQKLDDSADVTVMAYRFGYVDINQIEGIRYDGRYYGVEDVK